MSSVLLSGLNEHDLEVINKVTKQMGGWVLNWSGRENLCKEGILSWELNSFMAKSIRGRGKSQCAGCVAGISLAGSRNGRIIMATVLQWWLWVQRVWEALCPLCPCCLTLLWLRQELAGEVSLTLFVLQRNVENITSPICILRVHLAYFQRQKTHYHFIFRQA